MLRKFAYEYAYLSPMGWPCIYSRYSTSWMVIRIPSYWMGYFLLFGFGNGYRKSCLFRVIFLPYWGIQFDAELLLSFFPY